MKDSVHTKPDVDQVNLNYFKGLYSSNPNARDLIESLARCERLVVDHKCATYSQIIHRSIDVKDLLVLKPADGGEHDANLLASLVDRQSSSSADTTRYDIDSPRHTQLIEALKLAEDVKTALLSDVDAALGAVFCHPKFPWVIAAPFLDLIEYDGACILLYCHEVCRSDISPDRSGVVVVNQTAKDAAWRAVERMLHVMAARGRSRDEGAHLGVIVYLGLFFGPVAVKSDTRDRLPVPTTGHQAVLARLTPSRDCYVLH